LQSPFDEHAGRQSDPAPPSGCAQLVPVGHEPDELQLLTQNPSAELHWSEAQSLFAPQ